MRFLAADLIFTMHSHPRRDAVVVVTKEGVIVDVVGHEDVEEGKIEKFSGFICPGFINAHCHLELSYMKGKIRSGGGLHHFIREVENLKKPADEEVRQSAAEADLEMFTNGIVAVGDISNTNHSFAVKRSSAIYYHTFAEVYAFDPARAEAAFARGQKLVDELPDKSRSSITPHAPYSVSRTLLQLISAYAEHNHSILSIHNQETADEDLFFLQKKGSILERLKYFGIDTSEWQAPGQTSLRYTLPQLPSANKLLLVHNTFTSEADIRFAKEHHPALYWCFCPNANLYIEERVPEIENFIRNHCRITLGTDSYASNWSLSILDEIRALQKRYPAIRPEVFLSWATINGAKFLGIDNMYGSIEPNKKPGLNLISPDFSSVKRLI